MAKAHQGKVVQAVPTHGWAVTQAMFHELWRLEPVVDPDPPEGSPSSENPETSEVRSAQ